MKDSEIYLFLLHGFESIILSWRWNLNDVRVHLLVRTASIETHSTPVKTKKNDIVSMQRIKRELENWRERKRKGVIT